MKRVLPVLMLMLPLTGCGQKGALYLPPEPVEPAKTAPAANPPADPAAEPRKPA